MINTVKSGAHLDDPRDDRRSPRKSPDGEAADPATAKAAPAQPIHGQPDVRLVIEEDKARGAFIYKLIDRVTGEVLSEVSRDDLLKMGTDPLYTAGKVIDTKA